MHLARELHARGKVAPPIESPMHHPSPVERGLEDGPDRGAGSVVLG